MSKDLSGESDELLEFSGFRFDTRNHLLFEGEREIALPGRAVGVLAALLVHAGDLVQRQDLEDLVWGDTAVTAASLTEAISLLRHTLGDDPREPRFIQTVHRSGYRFLAEVERVERLPDGKPNGIDRSRSLMSWTATVGLAALLAAAPIWQWVGRASVAVDSTPVRLQLDAPYDHRFESSALSLAISPDGRAVVFGAHHDRRWRLFHRRLDSFESVPIAGSESGYSPFFSPDGESIGFVAGSELKTVRLDGGSPRTLATVGRTRGAAWVADGTIVFGSGHGEGLRAISAEGGEVRELTVPDRKAGEYSHWRPYAVSDQPMVAFTILSTVLDQPKIAVMRLPDGEIEELFHGRGAQYTAGHLLYLDEGHLRAARFDPSAPSRVGPSFLLTETILSWPNMHNPNFAASERGPLVYLPRAHEREPQQLRRVDREVDETLAFPPRQYRNLNLSPDGRRLALTIPDGERSDVWVGDIASGELFRLTTIGKNIEPVWAPDGESVVYASDRGGYYQLYRQGTNGQPGEPYAPSGQPRFPSDWMPGENSLIFSEFNPASRLDIGVLGLNGDSSSQLLIHTVDREADGKVSPDGRWMAFTRAVDSGLQIYVADLDADGLLQRVSTTGGERPEWTHDGSRLIYQRGDQVLGVESAQLESGAIEEQLLFCGRSIERVIPGRTPDELFIVPAGRQSQSKSLRVVLNWAEDLQEESPAETGTARPMSLFASNRH